MSFLRSLVVIWRARRAALRGGEVVSSLGMFRGCRAAGLGQTGAVNERAGAQLRVIKAVVNALGAAGISAWLFGGWGLDARIGRITREHGDIEFWLERADAERSKGGLSGAGGTALATQPPGE